jgi:nucleotide-binding universal stress UspA family protein
MKATSLFHVFRNTPFGRDTLLQSVYYAKRLGLSITLYIPRHQQFMMNFPNRSVTVVLDREFLSAPETARDHAEAILNDADVPAYFFEPVDFTSLDLPDVPVSFDTMCCPRSISDLSSKVGMGYIGPKVRQIVQSAEFPVLIPTPVYKPWHRIIAFFGGSVNAVKAVKVASEKARDTGLPLQLFTRAADKPQIYYEERLAKKGLKDVLDHQVSKWMFFSEGQFDDLLYEVPSDALVVLGAYGHGVIKEILFGSKMEEVQSILPNNMLIIGPHCHVSSL